MRAIRESPLQPVRNNLSVVPQNNSKIHGRARRPAPTTGRRVIAPYARNIFFRVVAGVSPVRGNVCYNRVGRGLAPAARCPFSEKIHARIKSHQNPRAGEHSSPLRLDRQTPICPSPNRNNQNCAVWLTLRHRLRGHWLFQTQIA